MKEFKERQGVFMLQLIGVSVVLFALHSYLLYHFATDTVLFFPVWHIYAFHIFITLIVFIVINYRFSSGKTDIFNLFMIMTFLKMALAIVFILPLILSDFENKQPDVFNFFIPYFVYLFLEVFALTRFLQKQ
ncbi:hypothetical protein N8Z45_00855 [bacterium]|nr:hypothetical protein [Winogradskyella sp.]MDC1230066.1 hypothetical protein [bacterium]MDC1503635.1 hypothetical protein [Winogradskyella sp.]